MEPDRSDYRLPRSQFLFVRALRQAVMPFVVALSLGVGGVAGSSIDDLREDRTAIIQLQQDTKRQNDRILEFLEKLALRATDEERLISSPCVCVDESPEGPDFLAVKCKIASRCDEAAIRDCEQLHPGFECKPLI